MRTGPIIALIVIIIAAAIVIPQSLYIVDETEVAIVTRLGAFQEANTTPGLRVKPPFAEKVTKFDKRLLRYDAPAASLLTADKRNLVIDVFARYRIVDPLLFFQRLQNEITANARIGDIISSELRREVALDLQSEIISETREEIMNRVRGASNRAEIGRDQALQLADGLNDPQLTILLTPPTGADGLPGARRLPTAEELDLIRNTPNAADIAEFEVAYFQPLQNAFGIEIVDVRIKRADFPQQIEQSIFDRMRAERERIASGLRAEGAQEDAEIRAEVDREVNVTLQQAEGTSARLRGEGEGEAILILAEQLERDPEFYAFQRALTAYSTILDGQSTLVLSADSDLFNYLESPTGSATAAP
ncbi:MAG: protease modulator HflC [Chloroflexi bacterium]|nr:protease modulator HflC [Chloroflexota bacterium]